MENVRNKGTAMGELGGNSSSSTLSVSMVNRLKKELEKSGMLFTPKLEEKLTKCMDETLEENRNQCVGARPLAQEQSEQATLHTLVYQFEVPEKGNVFMGMMINGKPEVLKNEFGSESTPAFAAFSDDKGFVYGTEAKNLITTTGRSETRHSKKWQCLKMRGPLFSIQQQCHQINLKEFGMFILPAQFFPAFLIRKLKVTAEAQCNGGGGLCQAAILAVPMQTKCAQRLRLKESVALAGFKDVYMTSAEGLAAYYWFNQKKEEMKQKNYSKEFVIIDLFGDPVVYQRSLESGSGTDGNKVVVVKAIILLDLWSVRAKGEDKFIKMLKKKLKIDQMKSRIPVIRQEGKSSKTLKTVYFGRKYDSKVAIVGDDKSDEFKYFAAKEAALLSENPGKIGHQVRNMIGTTITIELDRKEIRGPSTVLPQTSLSFTIKHDKPKYRINQYYGYNGVRSGWEGNQEMIGYLAINGVKLGTELKIDYELTWEGIWKVVGVSAKNPREDNDGGDRYDEVRWDFLGDKLAVDQFGSRSCEECKSLMLKVAPSPSQGQAIDEVESAEVVKGGWENSQDKAEGLGESSTTIRSSGVGNRKEEMKRTKSRVIRKNDIIVNKNLKKIKLESDWVEGVVKVEQDLREGLGEQQDIEVEEDVVKVEVEEEDITD